MVMLSGPPGLGTAYAVSTFDLYFTHGKLLLGANLRALDDEEIVFVAENAVLHEAVYVASNGKWACLLSDSTQRSLRHTVLCTCYHG